MTNLCGTCTACCKVFAIADLDKPAGKWCGHCFVGQGCSIYQDRPTVCVEFKCLWLESQSRADAHEHLPLAMRPDKSKCVISPSTNPNVMSVITANGSPDAWRRTDIRRLLIGLVKHGMSVVIGPAASTRKTMLDMNGERVVTMTPPDKDGMQWSEEDQR